MNSDVTYWLYHGTRVLTAVRMPEGTSDHMVKQKALDDQEKCPGAFGGPNETPYSFRTRLQYATVRRFEDRLEPVVFLEHVATPAPPRLRDVLRKIIATQLWSWSITLRCWAYKVHARQAAELDAELTKEKS